MRTRSQMQLLVHDIYPSDHMSILTCSCVHVCVCVCVCVHVQMALLYVAYVYLYIYVPLSQALCKEVNT